MIWAGAAVLLLICLGLLLWPLWRPGKVYDLDINAANVTLLKEQLAELEQEREALGLSDEAYQAARADLERSVAADLEAGSVQNTTVGAGVRNLLTVTLLIILPVASVLSYQKFTTFTDQPVIDPHGGQAGQNMPSLDEMIAMLETRLRDNPDDAKGWVMLGRSYTVMERYPEAARAYDRAYQLLGESDPSFLVDYADVVGTVNGETLVGRPTKLINRALELSPDLPKGLYLAGFAALQAKDPATAVRHWERLLQNPEIQGEDRQSLQDSIAAVRAQAGMTAAASQAQGVDQAPPAAAEGKVIRVSVTLDEAMARRAGPDEVVFVYARAAAGPPMPLAAARLKVADLPTEIQLSDAMAMMPGKNLSSQEQVIIGARVARAGTPTAQPGDLEGQTVALNVAETDAVSVTIDRQVK